MRCIKCGREHSQKKIIYTCECNGLLEVAFDLDSIKVKKRDFQKRSPGTWRYREFLPFSQDAKIISLQEGGTPLYKAENLGKKIGVRELYIKNEGANPSGSFKDRGMTVGVTKALELNVKTVGCASTGNTSASLAAYAAKANLKCLVILPAEKIALGKLAQAILHGATVVGIRGNFDVALKLITEASAKFNVYLLNSINPWRLEGQKTEAFEMAEQLSWEAPDRVVIPVGNCGNISAIWKGFKEFYDYGFVNSLPKLAGIQAEGAAPVSSAFKKGLNEVSPIANPDTIATAIRIGAPVNAPKALRAIRESGGIMEDVSDNEIISAQKLLARSEGIGVEPASAASIAGLIKLLNNGSIGKDERIVCVTTGHALKDPEMIFNKYEKPVEIEPTLAELEKIISS
ncbi:MAG: threonine synthase [Candidatus Hydrothermarchaeota archaeon]|nr:threonine synthase [Candidatus Hydrothermarchaeota archaeon]